MTYVWKPREDGINFREPAHENKVCGKSATGDYTCTRPKGHTGWHVASGIDGAYEVWPDGVFVPVPDGVAYDDALRAVNELTQWVPTSYDEIPTGARARLVETFTRGKADEVSEWFVHLDDAPDPDADLIERMARAILEGDPQQHLGFDRFPEKVQDRYRSAARAALAVIREDGAR